MIMICSTLMQDVCRLCATKSISKYSLVVQNVQTIQLLSYNLRKRNSNSQYNIPILSSARIYLCRFYRMGVMEIRFWYFNFKAKYIVPFKIVQKIYILKILMICFKIKISKPNLRRLRYYIESLNWIIFTVMFKITVLNGLI